MKILLCDRLLKKINNQNKHHVLHEITTFCNHYEENEYDIRKCANGYSVRQFEGLKSNQKIFKFRANKGDRILFTFGSGVEGLRDTFYHSIIFIDYCTHDEQVLRARNTNLAKAQVSLLRSRQEQGLQEISDSPEINLQETALDERIEADYACYEYDPNRIKTRVVEVDALRELALEDEIGEYYLNTHQYECIKEDYRPLFVFGSAGAGKTMVGIYKAVALGASGMKMAYFTYSMNLMQNSKRLFETLYGKKGNITFSVFNDYLGEEVGISSFIHFNDFKTWLGQHIYPHNRRYKRYQALDLWREIRGIIKGLVPLNIKEVKLSPGILTEDFESLLVACGYGELKDGIVYIKFAHLYELQQRFYYSYREELTKLLQAFEEQYVKRKMLTREEYVEDCVRYSFYHQEKDRQEVYELAQKYQAWLEEKHYVDDNDLAKKVIQKVREVGAVYDYIIVDEAQDLTEMQLYLMCLLVKEPDALFFTADSNQTINPTYFSWGRIESIYKLMSPLEEVNHRHLDLNYRCAANIVALCNDLTHLRKQKVGAYKANDYEEVAVMPKVHPTMLLSSTIENKKALLSLTLDRHYLAIVVPNETEKNKLGLAFKSTEYIYTLEEIKGIEKDYIICFNVISHYEKEWQHIVESTSKCEDYYRIYFNMLYVAMSRARKYLCFYEETSEALLRAIIQGELEEHQTFSLADLQLEQTSNEEELYKEALKEEKAGLYEKAMQKYKKLTMREAKLGIQRCEAQLLVRAHQYQMAADLFFEAADYENAAIYYKRLKVYPQLLRAYVRLGLNYEAVIEGFSGLAMSPLDLLEEENVAYEEYGSFYESYLRYLTRQNEALQLYKEAVNEEVQHLHKQVMRLMNLKGKV